MKSEVDKNGPNVDMWFPRYGTFSWWVSLRCDGSRRGSVGQFISKGEGGYATKKITHISIKF